MSHNLKLLSCQKMYGLLEFIRKLKALQRSARGRSWRVADTLIRLIPLSTWTLTWAFFRLWISSSTENSFFRLTLLVFLLWPPSYPGCAAQWSLCQQATCLLVVQRTIFHFVTKFLHQTYIYGYISDAKTGSISGDRAIKPFPVL